MKCLNCGEIIFIGNYCQICEEYMALRKEAMKKPDCLDEINAIDRALSIRKETVETRGKMRIRFANENKKKDFDFFKFMCEMLRLKKDEL
ncbi:MAG: hypothetical protein QXP60_05785 [Nitrososphaerota archaeon]